MSLLTITALAAAAFLLAYRFYGAFLAKRVFCLDDAKPTPVLLLVMLLAAPSVCAEERSKLLPTKQEAQKVCEYVAGMEKPIIQDYFLRRGYLDVNNDNAPEYIQSGLTGSMGGDYFEFVAQDGKVFSIEPEGFEWKEYWTHGQAILPFGGKVYFVHFKEEDMLYPSYLGYATADNREYAICEFKNKVTEFVSGGNHDFCAKLSAQKINPLLFDEENKLPYPVEGRRETGASKAGKVDFDNDGSQDLLVLLHYASGAGGGCDVNYFDTLAESKDKLLLGEKHNLLMKMQEIHPEDRHPGNCSGNETSWFTLDGTTYLENKYRDDAPTRKSQEFHTVTYLKNGEVETACEYGFIVETSVSGYKF